MVDTFEASRSVSPCSDHLNYSTFSREFPLSQRTLPYSGGYYCMYNAHMIAYFLHALLYNYTPSHTTVYLRELFFLTCLVQVWPRQ